MTTNDDWIERFDLRTADRSFLDDPYPVYRALRERDPVHRQPDGSVFLTRYDDVAAVYRDRRFSSDKKIEFAPKFGDSPLYLHHTTSLVFNDPPYHTRVRKLLAPAFTPRAVRILEPRFSALVDRLIRNWGRPEDFRYAGWRETHGARWWWRSFFQVFLLQGS